MELLLVEFVFSSSLELRITQKNNKIIRDFIEKYYPGFAFPCAEKDVCNVYYVYMFEKNIVGVTAIKIAALPSARFPSACSLTIPVAITPPALLPYNFSSYLTHISLILITPAWRRRGLATYALKHVIKKHYMQAETRKKSANTNIHLCRMGGADGDQAHSDSALTVSVTFEDPHLLQFYKKHGFDISHLDTASGLYTMTHYCQGANVC